jgi:uncharacterized damage-inducible protein DinB
MTSQPEPWLRGPVDGVPELLQPAAHALLHVREDIARSLSGLPTPKLWQPVGQGSSVGFHTRHVIGSLDRLLTYARGAQLSESQKAALKAEIEPGTPPEDAASLTARVAAAIDAAIDELRATPEATLRDHRGVGRSQLPSTVIGLLFHAAEHAQRHAGQIATTVRVLRSTD